MSESTYPSVKDLTLEEKASLTSGGDAWHLQGVESKGIPGYMITDGPHGLRKSLASSAGETDLDDSVPATCFPPAAGLSSSWNPELIHKVGEAMAEECIQEKVAVILGPGVNIKRNPLGGRCFEYWSEDPYLAGHEAIGIVEGVQSKGVGTSLKHFAANNQESDRLRVDARISPRALREIYFPAFEHIVKKAQPWTIMCSYNRINGVHSAQNHWLLTDVLRDEWGFEGIVMSDWGADHDRGASLNAGLNLEMPPSYTDDQIVYAVRDGRITPAQLDRMAQGMIDLVNKTRAAMSVDNYRFDVDAHDEVAHQAAIESIVMLKNDDAILPLNAGPVANPSAMPQKIAVIGEFARTPRYQGGGSSHITPTKMTSFLDTLAERGIKADVARPKHELKGFTKVFLKAGESKTVTIDLDERAFAYWSEKYNDWHVEAGEYAIEVGVSSRDIADTVAVALDGDGKTQPLTEWSTYGEWEADPFGAKIVAAVAAAGEAGELPKLPDNAMMRMFLNSMPINSLPTLLGEGGKKIAQFMVDEYAKLSK